MNIRKNVRQLTNIFLILFVALSAGLVYWQVIVAQQVTSNTNLNSNRQCTSDNAPVRGSIYDRNGVLLAYSVKSDIPGLCGYQRIYTAASEGLEGLIGYYINPFDRSTGIESQFNSYLNGQIGITGLDNTVNHVLHVPPHGDDIYLTVDSHIEKVLVQNFATETRIDDVQVFKTDRGSIVVSNPSTGEIEGIISRPGYDANCVVYCTLATLRTDMLAKNYNMVIGCASPCSMDQFKTALDQQKAALMAKLGPGCEQHSDCTIGSDCEDNSDCNQLYLRYMNSDPEQPLLFRPTQSCYPPGSTYKTVTLMAALDSGAFGLQDPVFYNDPMQHPYPEHLQAMGPVTVKGPNNNQETFPASISNIQGYTHNFPVTLEYGFSHSDNIIFLQAGLKTGQASWLKYNQALYVGQKIPFDLPVKVSTVTPQPQSGLCSDSAQPYTALNTTGLAENSFGQGVDFVTPMQMVLVDNVAADDGKLMQPRVVEKIVDPKSQTVLQSFSPQLLRQVISQTTSQQVRDAMYSVVACGSGSLSLVQLSYGYTPWSVIGKTGTAQVPLVNGKVQPGDSWFITAAPYAYQSNSIPPLTIVAMKENGGEGAYANGPMLRDIYGQIFGKIIKEPTPPMPPGGTGFCVDHGFLQA